MHVGSTATTATTTTTDITTTTITRTMNVRGGHSHLETAPRKMIAERLGSSLFIKVILLLCDMKHDAWGLRSVSTEVMSCVRSFSFEFQVRAPTWEGQGRARGTQGPPGVDQAAKAISSPV